jgi:septal ring factor EnvC (AmiA/AmiB activator)
MAQRVLIAIILLCAAPALLGYSVQDEIRRRQLELQAIRDQIAGLEKKIKQQQLNESEALDLVETYDRKATLVRKLIAKYRQEERELQRRIERTSVEATRLQSDLDFLKRQYAKYVASAYKSGRTRDLELLLSSRSINQFYVRTSYLRMFTAQRRRDAEEISEKKLSLDETRAHVQNQLTEERRLIAEKAAEEDRLTALAADRRSVLGQIRKDRKLLQRSIDRQMKAARELEDVISSLIESDRIKEEREEEEARRSQQPLPQPPASKGVFESRKGRLRWPVSQGTVVAKFGNQKHPTLRTVTVNTGIDIAVDPGSPVSAVADGQVAKIFWMPSYGNLLILNHAGGYRTVYTHLSEITVAEGQRVAEGDIIAQSGESLEGARLHFEIWKDREKQNPELWLSRQ